MDWSSFTFFFQIQLLWSLETMQLIPFRILSGTDEIELPDKQDIDEYNLQRIHSIVAGQLKGCPTSADSSETKGILRCGESIYKCNLAEQLDDHHRLQYFVKDMMCFPETLTNLIKSYLGFGQDHKIVQEPTYELHRGLASTNLFATTGVIYPNNHDHPCTKIALPDPNGSSILYFRWKNVKKGYFLKLFLLPSQEVILHYVGKIDTIWLGFVIRPPCNFTGLIFNPILGTGTYNVMSKDIPSTHLCIEGPSMDDSELYVYFR